MQASGFWCGLNMDRGLSVYYLSFKPGAEGTETWKVDFTMHHKKQPIFSLDI